MTLKEKLSDSKNLLILFHLILAIAIFFSKFDKFGSIFPDSQSYLNNSIFVPPLYPIFVDFMDALAGGGNYKAVCVIQYMLGSAAISYFIITLYTYFKIRFEAAILISFYMLPIYYNNYAVSILTESISFPLFFYFVSILVKTLCDKKKQHLLKLMVVAALLYLCRSQFIFLFPFLLVAFFMTNHFLKQRLFVFKDVMLLGFIAISAYYIPFLINYQHSGKFINSQGGGMVMINTPFYLAKAEDKNLFADKTEKALFEIAYNRALQSNSLKTCDKKKWKEPNIKDIDSYFRMFDKNWGTGAASFAYDSMVKSFNDSKDKKYTIKETDKACYNADMQHFFDTYMGRTDNLLYSFGHLKINDWLVLNPMLNNMAIKLIKAHQNEWMHLVALNSVYAVGGLAIFAMLLMVFLYIVIRFKKFKDASFAAFLAICIIMHFCNSGLIGLFAINLVRYKIYTSSLMVVAIIISIFKCFEKFKAKKDVA